MPGDLYLYSLAPFLHFPLILQPIPWRLLMSVCCQMWWLFPVLFLLNFLAIAQFTTSTILLETVSLRGVYYSTLCLSELHRLILLFCSSLSTKSLNVGILPICPGPFSLLYLYAISYTFVTTTLPLNTINTLMSHKCLLSRSPDPHIQVLTWYTLLDI